MRKGRGCTFNLAILNAKNARPIFQSYLSTAFLKYVLRVLSKFCDGRMIGSCFIASIVINVGSMSMQYAHMLMFFLR